MALPAVMEGSAFALDDVSSGEMSCCSWRQRVILAWCRSFVDHRSTAPVPLSARMKKPLYLIASTVLGSNAFLNSFHYLKPARSMHEDLQANLIAPPSLLAHLLPSPLNIHLQNLPTNLIDLDTIHRHRPSMDHHHEIIFHAACF